MAQHVHLFLKVNGKAIKGVSTETSLNRAGSIGCFHYEQGGAAPFDPSWGEASGQVQYKPIKIRKKIDFASPLLWLALTKNQEIEGAFRFYRPHAFGNGSAEHFFTVKIGKGYVAGIRQSVGNTFTPGDSNEPPLEEISLVFSEIVWTFEPIGIECEHTWDGKPSPPKQPEPATQPIVAPSNLGKGGTIECEIPPDARRGVLTIKDGDKREEHALLLGHTDPTAEITGIQARLNGLGFWCGKVDGVLGPQTEFAIWRFQIEHGLEGSGALDDDTRGELFDAFGH